MAFLARPTKVRFVKPCMESDEEWIPTENFQLNMDHIFGYIYPYKLRLTRPYV